MKQATKPMARAIKARAVASGQFSKLCEFFGQTWHVQTTKLNLRVQGHSVKGVKPLNEQEAVQSGAELIAEGFVLSLGVGALIVESRRSARSAAEKAVQKTERRRQKMEAMQHLNDTIRDLAKYSVALEKALLELDRNRLEHERSKKALVPLKLPPIPESIRKMIGATETPTEVAVAAHNKSVEENQSWSLGLIKKLTFDSATGVIKWVGSIVNADEGAAIDLNDGDFGDDEGDE